MIPEFQCALWWASKELQDGKILSDYVGRNDRTKIVAKIQKIGQSAPARYELHANTFEIDAYFYF